MKTLSGSSCKCLVFAFLSLVVTGCNEEIPLPDNAELLTAVVWGETNTSITDPELYTCVFEPSGIYYTTYRGYETYSGSWRLTNDVILKIDQSEVEITRLTPSVLEYRADAVFLGIHYKQTYHLQALDGSVSATIGSSDIKENSARLHGIIRSCSPSETLFEYGLNETYGLSTGRIMFQSPVHKHVSMDLTGLSPGTTYHYRIRVENEEGTYLGTDHTIRTYSDQTVTDADDNEYFTVVIGNQTWMAENLRTTRYNDGTSIARVTDIESWNMLGTPAFCWPENDSASYCHEGALYNWYTASSGKLCPAGWHVPSSPEWSVLFTYMTGREIELIECDYENYNDFIWDSRVNQTGFSAGLARIRSEDGYFSMSDYSHFWTGTENNGDAASFALLYYNYAAMTQEGKSSGLQVRCIKD